MAPQLAATRCLLVVLLLTLTHRADQPIPMAISLDLGLVVGGGQMGSHHGLMAKQYQRGQRASTKGHQAKAKCATCHPDFATSIKQPTMAISKWRSITTQCIKYQIRIPAESLTFFSSVPQIANLSIRLLHFCLQLSCITTLNLCMYLDTVGRTLVRLITPIQDFNCQWFVSCIPSKYLCSFATLILLPW